jgi:uncharacterized protein (DUF433 family)
MKKKTSEAVKKPLPVGEHLIVHPGVCHGKLTFKGTRVPVETILNRLAQGRTIKELRMSWPEVKRVAIAEAVQLATAALVDRFTPGARDAHEPTHTGRSA